MKVLTFVKLHLKIIGCLPIDANILPSWCAKLINHIHIAAIYLALVIFVCSTSWFFLFGAKSISDCIESVFWSSRAIISLSLYSMFIWYKPNLIEFLNNLDEIIGKRKNNSVPNKFFNLEKKSLNKIVFVF